MLTPVVIFVYNRPQHTRRTIEALANNFLAKETEVFIYSDSAKNNSNIELVNETRNYIDTLTNLNYFKKTEIIKAKKNKGLANSIISGVSEIIDRYGKVIVVEDDLISSNDFLSYMNSALDFYKNNEIIWSISGFNIPIEIPSDYSHDVYLSYRGCSWGWATWKDRWDKVDWNVSDYNKFKIDKKLRKKLNRGGRDMANMLDMQMEGKIDSWAIRWCYSQSKQSRLTVYPIKTRIKNIGLDGSGTHSGISTRYDFEFSNNNELCNFENVELNKFILKRFQNHYMKLHHYYLYRLKKLIKNLSGK
ncbi:glycosyltransferase [Haloplasma contractile]|uniref:Glycosyltransferase protein n=1 Tax=Haloplasma contractile SSD-17B TaxID=1033810 RepID=U2E6T9_9MOLU|nr:glycosyltransferase [Haloplasma contractile]ERJ10933.1 Glycosyltransferase protein [Haloplasma contractile SSD-17B]